MLYLIKPYVILCSDNVIFDLIKQYVIFNGFISDCDVILVDMIFYDAIYSDSI